MASAMSLRGFTVVDDDDDGGLSSRVIAVLLAYRTAMEGMEHTLGSVSLPGKSLAEQVRDLEKLIEKEKV